jgi:hypothetical protein
LKVHLSLNGKAIDVIYQIQESGRGTLSADLNGTQLDFIRENNPYRPGAARIPMESWSRHLKENGNQLIITLE